MTAAQPPEGVDIVYDLFPQDGNFIESKLQVSIVYQKTGTRTSIFQLDIPSFASILNVGRLRHGSNFEKKCISYGVNYNYPRIVIHKVRKSYLLLNYLQIAGYQL
jgi:hypothetical protein